MNVLVSNCPLSARLSTGDGKMAVKLTDKSHEVYLVSRMYEWQVCSGQQESHWSCRLTCVGLWIRQLARGQGQEAVTACRLALPCHREMSDNLRTQEDVISPHFAGIRLLILPADESFSERALSSHETPPQCAQCT